MPQGTATGHMSNARPNGFLIIAAVTSCSDRSRPKKKRAFWKVDCEAGGSFLWTLIGDASFSAARVMVYFNWHDEQGNLDHGFSGENFFCFLVENIGFCLPWISMDSLDYLGNLWMFSFGPGYQPINPAGGASNQARRPQLSPGDAGSSRISRASAKLRLGWYPLATA